MIVRMIRIGITGAKKPFAVQGIDSKAKFPFQKRKSPDFLIFEDVRALRSHFRTVSAARF